MAKKRPVKASSSSRATKQPAQRAFNWRRFWSKTALVSGFLAIIGISLTAYSMLVQNEYDLSAVGNGTPTVVQIHDPKCPMCQQLKSNLNAVKGEFSDALQFKVANITTQKGRKFAREYSASTVTLLLFNERGKRISSLEGVRSEDEIRKALARLARRAH